MNLLFFLFVCVAVYPRDVASFMARLVLGHNMHGPVYRRQPPLVLPMKGDSNQEQAMEALQSLGDFHQGAWSGKATSFTVTADVAAGIVLKKVSPEYQVDVKLAYSPAGDLALDEMYAWQQGDTDDATKKNAPRILSLVDSSVDCDAVDSSYSLHSTNQPDYFLSMADLIGTEKEVHFSVEQSIAVDDDARVRLWILYGEEEELIRVVVCEETRLPDATESLAEDGGGMSLSATDLMELQSDVDRIVDKIAGQVQGGPTTNGSNSSEDEQVDRLQRLQEALAKQEQRQSSSKSAGGNYGPSLTRHPMSLLEMTSGVWLGDSIIRDFATTKSEPARGGGKGFGSASTKKKGPSSDPPPFGSWAVGVQKVAREWLWDFGAMIRQNNDAGKSVGVQMEPALSQSISGSVCENQSLSRKIPKEQRMVYMDWNHGNGDSNVGFLLGSVSIQVPRFASFGTLQSKPFFTEFCVYQSTQEEEGNSVVPASSDPETALPAVVCSRICRLYNTEGQLKQGCTSFYSLKRFDSE